MRNLAILVMLLSAISFARCQNLVPNPSFEEYTICPDYFSQWSHAIGWADGAYNSPDYFNACASGIWCSVPFNSLGNQNAAQGQAYMGVAYFSSTGLPYREIITAQLTEPLQPNVQVYMCFKASPGGYSTWAGNSAKWAANHLGMSFFTVIPDWDAYLFDNPPDWDVPAFPNTAQLYMDSLLNDTSAWVSVSGSFTPDSAYQYIAIGNFFDDGHTQYDSLGTNSGPLDVG